MAKLDNTVLNKAGQQKALDAYGMDAQFDDGRTKKQNLTRDFICKHFPVKDIILSHFNPPFLYTIVSLDTGHLLKFKIDANGYYKQFTIPVFGGVNTVYRLPVVKNSTDKNQIKISWQRKNNIRKATLKALTKIIIRKCLLPSVKCVALLLHTLLISLTSF